MVWLAITSFVLEVTGLILTFIEIKFPEIADKVEDWVDGMEFYLKNIGNRSSKTYTFETTLTLSILNGLIFGFWWLGSKMSSSIQPPILPITIWVIIFGIFLYTALIIGFFLTSEFIDFLNKFSNGRALGTLGLIIGMVGITIEIIQMFL